MALKKTSQNVVISHSATETAANTFESSQINLQLSPLDNEIFVVTMVNLDPDAPDSITGVSTSTDCTLSTTSRTTVGNISDNNVIAASRNQLICNAAMTADGGHVFAREDPISANPDTGYVGIIATDHFFLNLAGIGNGNVKNARVKIYGYRAKADSSTYAALVASELLSQ